MSEEDNIVKSSVENRSANDYATALSIVAAIAGIAADVFFPEGKVFKKGANVAATLTTALPRVKEVSETLRDNADVLSPAFDAVREKTPKAANSLAKPAKEAVEKIATAATDAASKVTTPLAEGIESMKADKARKEARGRIIHHAFGTLSTEKFLADLEAHDAISGGKGEGYLGNSGCFIFLTLGKGHKKELADYKDVYVESAANMGKAIKDQLDGRGNIDVYADVKYDQNVNILIYPCEESGMEQMKEALIVALDADQSYNQ